MQTWAVDVYRGKVAPSERGLRFGAPLIEWGEYDRPEFVGTDQLERGPRCEAPFQKCVMAAPHRNFEPFGAHADLARKNSNPVSPGQTCAQKIEPCGAPELSKMPWGAGDQNFRGRKNRFPRQTLKSKFSIFRRRRPDALLTDPGHGGFAFFAHRH